MTNSLVVSFVELVNLKQGAPAGGGCLDELACNYDADATEDMEAVLTEEDLDYDGNCLEMLMKMIFVTH